MPVPRTSPGAVALAVVLVLTACSPLTGADRPNLGVSNGTTLVVTLVVNNAAVGEFPPGEPGSDIDEMRLPPLPWTVEARSPSGRVLTDMRVEPGMVWTKPRADGGTERSGVLGRVDLSCGSLRIWAGDVQPSGPVPGPGQPGDCEP